MNVLFEHLAFQKCFLLKLGILTMGLTGITSQLSSVRQETVVGLTYYSYNDTQVAYF